MKKYLLGLTLGLIAAFTIPAFAQVATYDLSRTWNVYNSPAAATNAVISVAASNTLRHVATSLTVCVGATANQAPLQFVLRDGATGAGTIIWTARLGGLANTSHCVAPSGLWVGTKGTAMTLETTAAPASTNFATVSISGYSAQR